jgi:alkaline phosphatase
MMNKMKRREFLHTGSLAALAGTIATPALLSGCRNGALLPKGKAKNIIFLVSDGMSSGTLNMADLLMRRKLGRPSTWIQLYQENRVSRALMDTAAANSLVTDSAAACSAWGGGRRVNNGALNVNPDGSDNKPILQKFRDAGKSVGCITTVPITHATPAGFCVNMKHRNMQDKIASEYMELKFDVMMGGGLEYFDGSKREDKTDIFNDFVSAGFQVVKTKAEMEQAAPGNPVIGVFQEDGLPYALDMENNEELGDRVPTLAEMTKKAIGLMSGNGNGFVLQVEGGKVDWAAHANDASALIYDQVAFDHAVTEAMAFAEGRNDTLVIITTDHGNANPGLIMCKKVDQMFDTLQTVRYTNEWVLSGVRPNDAPAQLIERLNHAQGITITHEEAKDLLSYYAQLDDSGNYDPYKLPFRRLAEIQQNYTSVYWSGMSHSSDYVELAMFGPGSEALRPFVLNHELHNFMLAACGVAV